jgi:hypothetical protein
MAEVIHLLDKSIYGLQGAISQEVTTFITSSEENSNPKIENELKFISIPKGVAAFFLVYLILLAGL